MVNVRIAESDAEKVEVYRFRYEYFQNVVQRFYVRGLDHVKKVHIEEIDAFSRHYYLEQDSRILGVLRHTRLGDVPKDVLAKDDISDIFNLEAVLKIAELDKLSMNSRLILDQSARGSAALGILFSRVYMDGLLDGVELDFLTAAPSAIQVYRKSGYRRYRSGIEHPENGYDVPMVLMLNDTDHLTSIKSPLLRTRRAVAHINSDLKLVEGLRGALWSRFKAYDEDTLRLPALELSFALADEGIFASLSREEIDALFTFVTVFNLEPGEQIIAKHQRRDEMYVLLKGQLSVAVGHDQKDPYLVRPGEVVGEMALLLGQARSADIVAQLPSVVLLISRDAAIRMMKRNSELAAKLFFNISKCLAMKLANANERQETNGE